MKGGGGARGGMVWCGESVVESERWRGEGGRGSDGGEREEERVEGEAGWGLMRGEGGRGTDGGE